MTNIFIAATQSGAFGDGDLVIVYSCHESIIVIPAQAGIHLCTKR